MSKELYQYLTQFISKNRVNLFEQIILNRTRYVTLVVENLYQPHNISAVLRSCDCFGIQDVHVIENGNKFSPDENISLGSQKWLTVHRYHQKENNTRDCLTELKNRGYKVIATSPHRDSVLIQDLPLDQKVAMVFGTEYEGISEDVVDCADGFVKIPMYGFTESYNISVAAALTMYQIRQNLERMEIPWQLNEEQKWEILCAWAKKSIKMGEKIIEEYYQKRQL